MSALKIMAPKSARSGDKQWNDWLNKLLHSTALKTPLMHNYELPLIVCLRVSVIEPIWSKAYHANCIFVDFENQSLLACDHRTTIATVYIYICIYSDRKLQYIMMAPRDHFGCNKAISMTAFGVGPKSQTVTFASKC